MVKRQTIQYALVSETVKKMRKHASADEIYNAIAKDHPTIGRGTVYRNLQRLSELGEIRKREIPGGADRYDFLCTDHYHVVCTKCGQVFDVGSMDYMKEDYWRKQLKIPMGLSLQATISFLRASARTVINNTYKTNGRISEQLHCQYIWEYKKPRKVSVQPSAKP